MQHAPSKALVQKQIQANQQLVRNYKSKVHAGKPQIPMVKHIAQQTALVDATPASAIPVAKAILMHVVHQEKLERQNTHFKYTYVT